MPAIDEDLDRRQLLYSLLMPVMNMYMPGLDKGKGLYFLFVKSETKTPGGLLARSVLTSYYKSDHFKARPYDPYNVYTSPNEAVLCQDSFQSMYFQMLCGLYDREQVLRLGAIFAFGLLRAIRFLQLNWKELCEDIRTGTLNNASKLLNRFDTNVVEYTSYADTRTIPGHYVIFWELLVKNPTNYPTEEVLEQCCLAMEECLNSVYRQGRVECNSIRPLELRVVKNGTFEEVMDYALSRGTSINQYKVPRCTEFEF